MLNDSEARYCIRCGLIIKPIFCSLCGAVNPVGLANCLECGNHLPKISSMNWDELVIRENESVERNVLDELNDDRQRSFFMRIRSRFKRGG